MRLVVAIFLTIAIGTMVSWCAHQPQFGDSATAVSIFYSVPSLICLFAACAATFVVLMSVNQKRLEALALWATLFSVLSPLFIIPGSQRYGLNRWDWNFFGAFAIYIFASVILTSLIALLLRSRIRAGRLWRFMAGIAAQNRHWMHSVCALLVVWFSLSLVVLFRREWSSDSAPINFALNLIDSPVFSVIAGVSVVVSVPWIVIASYFAPEAIRSIWRRPAS
jgi:hypothetical protein